MDRESRQRHVRRLCAGRRDAGGHVGLHPHLLPRAGQDGSHALQGVSHRDATGDVWRGFGAEDIQGGETVCDGRREEGQHRPHGSRKLSAKQSALLFLTKQPRVYFIP